MEVVAVYNPEYEEVTIFAVNRNIEHDEFHFELRGI